MLHWWYGCDFNFIMNHQRVEELTKSNNTVTNQLFSVWEVFQFLFDEKENEVT